MTKMIIEFRSIFQFVCLLVTLQDSVFSLPFSGVSVHAVSVGVWDQDNITEPDHSEFLQDSNRNMKADDHIWFSGTVIRC